MKKKTELKTLKKGINKKYCCKIKHSEKKNQ